MAAGDVRAQPGGREQTTHARAAREAVAELVAAKLEGDELGRRRAARKLDRHLAAHVAELRRKRLP